MLLDFVINIFKQWIAEILIVSSYEISKYQNLLSLPLNTKLSNMEVSNS